MNSTAETTTLKMALRRSRASKWHEYVIRLWPRIYKHQHQRSDELWRRNVAGLPGELLAAAADLRLDVVHADVRRPVDARDDRFGNGGMLRLPVPPQVDLPLECLFAEAAGKRLVARVLAHVRYQIGRLAERFRAHDALVRFFACNKDKIISWVSLWGFEIGCPPPSSPSWQPCRSGEPDLITGNAKPCKDYCERLDGGNGAFNEG